MLKKGKPQQNLLPGTDQQADCQSSEGNSNEIISAPAAEETDQDHDHDISWHEIDLAGGDRSGTIASWIPQRAGWSIFLERVALAVEKPANRLIGTAQLNPFYHTGTIATLLLIIVALPKAYYVVTEYMHIRSLWKPDEESHS